MRRESRPHPVDVPRQPLNPARPFRTLRWSPQERPSCQRSSKSCMRPCARAVVDGFSPGLTQTALHHCSRQAVASYAEASRLGRVSRTLRTHCWPDLRGITMKLAAAWVLALVLLLCGCSGAGSASPSLSASSPSATKVMRDLETGEQVSLRCGVSLTVPASYDGFYAEDSSATLGLFDTVSSHRLAQTGLLQSFYAESVAPTGEEGLAAVLSWSLVVASEDGAVEVRSVSAHQGTAEAVTMIAVIVRRPDRPVGHVSMAAYGEQASDAPAAVMAQVESMWERFAVQGAALPALE
jgi:hypothetical protein